MQFILTIVALDRDELCFVVRYAKLPPIDPGAPPSTASARPATDILTHRR
jgi:hypothetical protein